jgi:hypothetical protein
MTATRSRFTSAADTAPNDVAFDPDTWLLTDHVTFKRFQDSSRF